MLPDASRLDQGMCACRFQFVRFTELAEAGRIISNGNLTTRTSSHGQYDVNIDSAHVELPCRPEFPSFRNFLSCSTPLDVGLQRTRRLPRKGSSSSERSAPFAYGIDFVTLFRPDDPSLSKTSI
jgi:hypothetical protein